MNINKKLINIYSFMLGLFGFSMLGQYIQLNVLKLPFYFVELFFIPVILMNLSSILGIFNRVRYSTVFLLVFIFMSMLSNILNTGELFSAIFSYRAILYLLFFMCYFRLYKKDIPLNLVFTIVLGAICGELVYVLIFSTSLVTSSVNCLAIAIAIWIPYLQKKYFLTVLIVMITLFLAINTGFRIGIIVVAFTILNLFLYSLINGKQYRRLRQKFKIVLFFGLGFCGLVLFISNLNFIIEKIASITGMSSFAIFRVTTRLESLITLDFSTSQDIGRLDMFIVFFERIWNIIPRGLIGSVEGGLEYSYYIDTPPLYLFDIFGSVMTILIYLYFSLLFIMFAKHRIINNQIEILSVWLIPLLGMLSLTNGTFMVNSGQAIMTGIILGYVTRKKKKYGKEREFEHK